MLVKDALLLHFLDVLSSNLLHPIVLVKQKNEPRFRHVGLAQTCPNRTMTSQAVEVTSGRNSKKHGTVVTLLSPWLYNWQSNGCTLCLSPQYATGPGIQNSKSHVRPKRFEERFPCHPWNGMNTNKFNTGYQGAAIWSTLIIWGHASQNPSQNKPSINKLFVPSGQERGDVVKSCQRRVSKRAHMKHMKDWKTCIKKKTDLVWNQNPMSNASLSLAWNCLWHLTGKEGAQCKKWFQRLQKK